MPPVGDASGEANGLSDIGGEEDAPKGEVPWSLEKGWIGGASVGPWAAGSGLAGGAASGGAMTGGAAGGGDDAAGIANTVWQLGHLAFLPADPSGTRNSLLHFWQWNSIGMQRDLS